MALGPREKRRMAQLAVCLALFLVVFIGKGVFPGKLAEVRETVLSAIQADTDFKAAFASLGRSISEGEPILDTLSGMDKANSENVVGVILSRCRTERDR